ncbi:MAG: hypothetical protein EZS28_040043, partial [Streblomastix strix]
MISKTLERPPEVKDDILWDLLAKMLAFDRKDRISASDALNHEFFTSDKVLNEISKEVRNIALAAQTSKNKGNHYVTQYDTNSLYIIPLRKIKQILSDDPESVYQISQPNTEQNIEQQTISDENLKILEVLKLPLDGSEQHNKRTIQLQVSECLNITNRLKDKDDSEQRNEIVNSGITQQLSTIFEKRDLSTISQSFVQAYLCITFPYPWELRNQIYLKKNPYPGLFRLLDHDDIEVVHLAIRSIASLLVCGLNGILNTEVNQHFEAVVACDGINKTFSLFKQTKYPHIKHTSAICIGRLFHSKEIIDKVIKQEVIQHLQSIVNDSDKWTRESAKDALSYLAQNSENRQEIMKSINLKSIAELSDYYYYYYYYYQ